MGCRVSAKKYRPSYEMTVDLREIVEQWQLTKAELEFVYSVFVELDEDGSGLVDRDEFFLFLREPKTRFLETMFSFIVDGKSELDFPAWLKAVFGFCLTTRDEMIERVFLMSDVNRNGYIELAELHAFLSNVHSDNVLFPQEVVSALTKQCLAQDGRLDFDDFVQAEHKFPMLLWPIFRVQHRMRKRTFGAKFFNRISKRADDTYLAPDTQLQSRWLDRWESMVLYCCGWGCCRKPRGVYPTPVAEVKARKRAARVMNANQNRRLVEPRGGSYQFKPLPDAPHHAPMDHIIERRVLQVHVEPLTKHDLTNEPPRMNALDANRNQVVLSEGESGSESLTEFEVDEYPDVHQIAMVAASKDVQQS